MKQKYHYIYRIINITKVALRIYYYGVRSTNLRPENDLGNKYFSTSTNKEFIKDQKENPHNYKYKIIRVFKTRKEATELEVKLHEKFNVKLHEKFYNKANQTSTGFEITGTVKKYRPLTEDHKNKIRVSLKNNKHLLGKPLTEDHKNKIGNAQKGKKKSF